MHIRLQRFYLGLHICKLNFTLFFSATSRTQTGFTRIRCLQTLSPTASSPSDLAPSIVPCHSKIFTVASPIFSVDRNGTAVLLHCKSDSPGTFLFLLLHWSKLLSFPTHRSAAVKRSHATTSPHREGMSELLGTVCCHCCSSVHACVLHNVPEKISKQKACLERSSHQPQRKSSI